MRVVSLAGEIVMLPGGSLDGQLRQLRADGRAVPGDIAQIHADLNSRRSVSVTVDQPRSPGRDPSLLVHGPTYVIRLYLRRNLGDNGDAYTIAAITPMRLRDHDRLARGCLLLRPVSWRVVYTPRDIPDGSKGYWPTLLHEWAQLSDSVAVTGGAPALTPAHEQFLDSVSRVIDATERITKETERAQVFPYRKVSPTSEVLHGTQSAYEFELVGAGKPDKGAVVEVRGVPEQRGRVFATGDTVTVKFDETLGFDRISPQGHLEVRPSSVTHQTRRAAVNLLRDRQAQNTNLLRVLVDNDFRHAVPEAAEPTERLDDDQLAAFRSSLTVPDILCVLGPPGTGKTRTISQIVHANATATASAGGRRRVLVTAHTNRAVDNILPRLPVDLLTIRVGNENAVTEDGKPYLLELRAAELRQTIQAGIEPTRIAYQNHEHAARWLVELDRRLAAMTAAMDYESQVRTALDAARRAAGGPAQIAVDTLTLKFKKCAARLCHIEDKVTHLATRQKRASVRANRRIVGGYFRFLVRRANRRLAAYQSERALLDEAHELTREDLLRALSQLDEVTKNVPAVRAAKSELDSAVRRRVESSTEVGEAEAACREALMPIGVPPAVRTDADPHTRHADYKAFSSWLHDRLPMFAARAQLLREWATTVSGETRQLYPELIRYADVIAATATGTGIRPELSEVEFDLAVVDEAGQIAIPDILIPLVRVRRAVIVGDHRQLPPFLAEEVRKWGVTEGDPVVESLLTKSALEIMVERFPATKVVQLGIQRRMPAVIAEFISSAFYNDQLDTDVERAHEDELFAAQFAFVDTASLPPATRGETKAGAESFGRSGYFNEAEAELLIRLAAHYHRLRAEWAVIVPYMAQANLIRSRLNKIVGNSAIVELNVGTVDSFQGGERDVILYGFTRSNPDRRVGFLDELRRANVAFTRAKQQLVLVGDLGMLADAKDVQFRTLLRKLRDYLRVHGDIRRYHDILDRLDDVDKGHEPWHA